MAQVVLEVGDAQVQVDVATVDVAVSAVTADVAVTASAPSVVVAVPVTNVEVSAPQADINVYTSNPIIEVDLVGHPGQPGKQGDPGPKGDPGPQGPPPTPYVHLQTVLANVWVVEHQMSKHPAVVCEDGGGSLIYGTVTYTDDNTVLVGFAYPITGRANCI